ncbi:MAG: hypothetical protein K2Q01_02860 [Rickettsiales bacterium]|nr:hypothetical protein [Rickettsiales bacterium]
MGSAFVAFFVIFIGVISGAQAAEELGRITTGKPDTHFPVSTTTPTGHVVHRAGKEVKTDSDEIDFPAAQLEKPEEPYSFTHNPTNGNDGSAARTMNALPIPASPAR